MARSFKTVVSVDELASASSEAIRTKVDGDTQSRLSIDAGGKVTWGSGAATGDVNLYRDAADALKTDDTLEAAAGLITSTSAGAPTATIADGALAVDTTNDAFYFRSGAAWQQVTGGGGSITTSDTAPVSPDAGDLWYETDTGRTLVYYADGTSSQWVEVGASASVTSRLVLQDDDADTKVQVEEGTDDDTIRFDTLGVERMVIKSDGKVGIGTSAPLKILHVEESDSGVTPSASHHIIFESADDMGVLIGSGTDKNGYIRFGDSGSQSAGGFNYDHNDNSLKIRTNGTDHIGITSAGKVGIGTTTPVTPLHIESDDGLTTFTGTGRGAMSIANTAYTSGDLQAIDFMYLTGSNPCVRIAAEMTGGGSLLHFGTSNAYATGITNQAMTIDATGLVGIGTTAPDEPLHVVHTTDIARIKVEGASSGYTQSDILLESVGSSRGAGIYTFNSGNDKTWFFGSPYINTDEFIVARVSNAAFQESTASTGNAYLRIGWQITGNAYFASTLVYDRYTTTAENVNVNSSGLIRRSTSSARYKTDIETLWDDEADKVLQLRPAWFRSTSSEDRSDWSHEGFIAEEVDKVNQRWCTYGPVFITDDDGAFITDDDGVRLTETDANGEEILQPEAVQYTRIIPALVNVVQRQQTQIDALLARIETLEAP